MAPRLPVNLIFAHLLALELRCPVQSSSTRNQFSVLDATVSCTNLSRSCTQFLGFSTIDQYGMNEEASNEMVICMKDFIPWVRTSAFVPLPCSRRAATASTRGGGPRFGWWRAQAGARHAGVAARRGLAAVARCVHGEALLRWAADVLDLHVRGPLCLGPCEACQQPSRTPGSLSRRPALPA